MRSINALRTALGAILLAVLIAAPARAEDAFFVKRIIDLDDLPAGPAASLRVLAAGGWSFPSTDAMDPSSILDGPGEIYLDWPSPVRHGELPAREVAIVVRAPAGRDVTGRFYLPDPEDGALTGYAFTIPHTEADPAARERFLLTKLTHYQRLVSRRIPGGAWFRHQARTARLELGDAAPDSGEAMQQPTRWAPPNQMEDTFALMSGGLALSENLQLDRVLAAAGTGTETIAIDTLEGITVREFDFAALGDGTVPETDPLAAFVPADQHVVLFRTFQDLIDLADDAAAQGTPILRSLDPRAEDASVRARYETQLCLPLNDLARELGPRLIDSVALTGADPYLRTGADVAVLFEAKNVPALRTALAASVTLLSRAHPDATPRRGTIDGVPYIGLRSPERRICSYVATLDGTVAVTNSLAQLRRLVATWKGTTPALASLEEYAFFRTRYPRGDESEAGGETALLVVSDATIRRWCGPRWRIGTSRRTRAAAVMAEVQASYMDRLAAGAVKPGPVHVERAMFADDELTLGPEGVRSERYGTMEFQTPIVELDLDRVTKEEGLTYVAWRDRYQFRWRDYFDPIAARFDAGPDGLGVDLTVMPLIAGTQYGEFIAIAKGATITENAGDPHDESILHAALAVNREAPMIRMYSGMAQGMAPQINLDPLGWLGESIALYIEDDPVWAELIAKNDERGYSAVWDELHRLPVALHVDVSSGIRLAAFLTALRGFADQTAPGMMVWENKTHGDVPYVTITPSEMAKSDDDALAELEIFYAASGDALIVCFDEGILKRAIDRQRDRRTAKTNGTPVPRSGPPWLGESLCLQATRAALAPIEAIFAESYRQRTRLSAWANIPILNEWRRRYPDEDPVALHERVWHRRLVCPGGGEYRWNEEALTMESTVYGHPGGPKPGPALPASLLGVEAVNMGVTFEEEGLRARVQLDSAKTTHDAP